MTQVSEETMRELWKHGRTHSGAWTLESSLLQMVLRKALPLEPSIYGPLVEVIITVRGRPLGLVLMAA
jgi:hypothetical protein